MASDRDVLALRLLLALTYQMEKARSDIGQARIQLELALFDALALARVRAAKDTDRDVGEPEAIGRGTYGSGAEAVEHGRVQISAIARILDEFRSELDDFKPSGRPKETVWIASNPDAEAARNASVKVVEKVWDIRGEIRQLRRDLTATMTLLTSADTGDGLQRLNTLLHKAEDAERVGVAAVAATVVIATAALGAAFSAIPSRAIVKSCGSGNEE